MSKKLYPENGNKFLPENYGIIKIGINFDKEYALL